MEFCDWPNRSTRFHVGFGSANSLGSSHTSLALKKKSCHHDASSSFHAYRILVMIRTRILMPAFVFFTAGIIRIHVGAYPAYMCPIKSVAPNTHARYTSCHPTHHSRPYNTKAKAKSYGSTFVRLSCSNNTMDDTPKTPFSYHRLVIISHTTIRIFHSSNPVLPTCARPFLEP